MNTTVSIVPVTFYPIQATFVTFSDVYVNIGSQTANCQYTFLDSGSNPINSSAGRWIMDTGTYAGWQGDDQYFLNAAISGLGLTPTS